MLGFRKGSKGTSQAPSSGNSDNPEGSDTVLFPVSTQNQNTDVHVTSSNDHNTSRQSFSTSNDHKNGRPRSSNVSKTSSSRSTDENFTNPDAQSVLNANSSIASTDFQEVNSKDHLIGDDLGTSSSPISRSSDVHATSESENDYEDGEEEDEEDGEEDPLFGYARVQGLPLTFFKKDMVSAVYFGPEVHVWATHSGIVHLERPDGTSIRTVRVHRASVLSISWARGYIATASIDGTVVIAAVDDVGDTTLASFHRPVHAVALHPEYPTFKSYMSGGTAGQVVLSEKGWVRARSDSVLYQGSSTIVGLRWFSGGRAVWCNDDGIIVYDSNSQSILQRLSRLPNSPRADLFRPCISLASAEAVLVGWTSTVWKIELETGRAVQCFQVDGILAGILPFENEQKLVLTAAQNSQPELKLLDSDGSEVYADELDLARLGPNDYHLVGWGSGPWYVVSTSDAVAVRRRTVHDHVWWLADRGRAIEAWTLGITPEAYCSNTQQRQLALGAAQQLIELNKWKRAAQVLAEALPENDAAQWDHWAKAFIQSGHPALLGDMLPNDLQGLNDIRLNLTQWACAHDRSRLGRWLSSWDVHVYDSGSAAADLARNSPTHADWLVLGDLWLALDVPLLAVDAFVGARSPKALDVVSERHLWNDVKDLQAVLLQSHSQKAMARVVEARLEIPPVKVVDRLEGRLLYEYLDLLEREDELQFRQFADLQVELLAEFDRSRLLNFLECHSTYNLERAIRTCRQLGLDEELVYLLGEVGQPEQALDLIVDHLEDPQRAVAFARTRGNLELWDHLIGRTINKPAFVLALLECVDVSPIRVLSRVPQNMRIPGLKDTLCRVLADQHASIGLASGSLAIVKEESQALLKSLLAEEHRGDKIDPTLEGQWNTPVLLYSETKNDTKLASVPEPRFEVHGFTDKIRHLGWLLKNRLG